MKWANGPCPRFQRESGHQAPLPSAWCAVLKREVFQGPIESLGCNSTWLPVSEHRNDGVTYFWGWLCVEGEIGCSHVPGTVPATQEMNRSGPCGWGALPPWLLMSVNFRF